jgi:hypothetical protein
MSVQLSSLNIPAGAPAPRPDAAGRVSGASVNAAAALRNFQMHPRLDYGTITGVNGPLVILDNVKVRRRAGTGGACARVLAALVVAPRISAATF